MDSDEWLAIIHVADWLRVFRSATTQMSATQRSSVLSTTHAIFRGLQEHVLNIFQSLPADTPQIISNSLLDAYRKLSDYYYKFDESPFYCWAACKLYLVMCRPGLKPPSRQSQALPSRARPGPLSGSLRAESPARRLAKPKLQAQAMAYQYIFFFKL
jgi:hypothetical protein